jgi:hypothetical protein
VQGYYHHGSALLAVGRAWDARNSFAQALALSPKTQLFVEGLAQAEAAYTSTYHPRHRFPCLLTAPMTWSMMMMMMMMFMRTRFVRQSRTMTRSRASS